MKMTIFDEEFISRKHGAHGIQTYESCYRAVKSPERTIGEVEFHDNLLEENFLELRSCPALETLFGRYPGVPQQYQPILRAECMEGRDIWHILSKLKDTGYNVNYKAATNDVSSSRMFPILETDMTVKVYTSSGECKELKLDGIYSVNEEEGSFMAYVNGAMVYIQQVTPYSVKETMAMKWQYILNKIRHPFEKEQFHTSLRTPDSGVVKKVAQMILRCNYSFFDVVAEFQKQEWKNRKAHVDVTLDRIHKEVENMKKQLSEEPRKIEVVDQTLSNHCKHRKLKI